MIADFYSGAAGAKILHATSYDPYFTQNTTWWNATDYFAALTQFIPRAITGSRRREPLPGA
jgi:hypothetical protein